MQGTDLFDPSSEGGWHVIYDRELSFEVRSLSTPDQPGAKEPFRVKGLIQGEESAPQGVRLEITSETNLWYFFIFQADEAAYKALASEQKLISEFQEFPIILIRMLNGLLRESQTNFAMFFLSDDASRGRLDFIQSIMQYKFVELLSLEFRQAAEPELRKQIHYRFALLKTRLAMSQGQLQDLKNLIRLRNPSLLRQISHSSTGTQQRSPLGSPPRSVMGMPLSARAAPSPLVRPSSGAGGATATPLRTPGHQTTMR
eukprot:GAFH01003096.1.p1 GENE.GAFH01003096.1~~GAFH01003096.1.p1  ORF type:complete len:290 (+),score=73.23 GAFH01003096.1:101-871(+)